MIAACKMAIRCSNYVQSSVSSVSHIWQLIIKGLYGGCSTKLIPTLEHIGSPHEAITTAKKMDHELDNGLKYTINLYLFCGVTANINPCM
jgi:hypothetical protein